MSQYECQLLCQVRRALTEARSREPDPARAPDTLFLTPRAAERIADQLRGDAHTLHMVMGLDVRMLPEDGTERFALGLMQTVLYSKVEE